MKKSLYLTPLLLTLMACNSNETINKDELLSETTWEYHSINVTPDSNVDHIYFDPFASISQYFSDVKYSAGNFFTTERFDTLYHQGEYFNAILKFENEECRYNEECFRKVTISRIENKFQIYTFEEATYNNEYINATLQIKSNDIYLYMNGEGKKVCTLDNFKMNKYLSSTIVETRDEKIYKLKYEESFHFLRTENEVVLSNKDKKWIGTLNRENWNMEVIQISPERKDLHTFTLK